MTVIVIAVDPGDSTGVAIIKDTELWHAFQGTPEDALTLVELTITRFNVDGNIVIVVGERYVNMQSHSGRTHQPTAQRVIGVLEHLAASHNVTFVLQGPADAWAIASNLTLRQLGMYQTSKMLYTTDADDANMAVRHALLYLSHTHATLFHAILRRHGIMS
jgi:hypothetical protein